MYIETVPNRNSRPAILLRQGWREGQRVRKKTLANLTDWPAEKVEALRQVLKGQRLVAPEDAFTVERSLPHGHVEALLAMTRRLGLERLIAPKRCPERDRVLAMVLERLLHPASKLATTRLWHSTTLAEELGVGDDDEDDLYEAMDWLLKRQERIEQRLAKRHLHEGKPVFADVSSSYYEGRTCPLMRFGYNRDGKRGKTQVVYAVLSAPGGCPVAVQAYPGNTADPNTVPDQVTKLKERFGLERVVLVGDRGLLTQVQIEHLKRHRSLGWVSALKAPQIRALVEQDALQLSLFDEQNLAEIVSPDYPGERLVACYNPLLAGERARKREELLAATEAGLERVAREAARRTRTPLDAAELGRKVGRVLGRHKMGKHFEWGGPGRAVTVSAPSRAGRGRSAPGRDLRAAHQRGRPSGCRARTRCAPTRGCRTWSAGSAPSRGSKCGCVPSAIARSAEYARICSCACLPAMWNGTFAAPWHRCCSRMKPWNKPGAPATRSPRPSPRPALARRRPVGVLTTAWPFTVSIPCSPNSPRAAAIPAGCRLTLRLRPSRSSPSPPRPNAAPLNSSKCSQCRDRPKPENRNQLQ